MLEVLCDVVVLRFPCRLLCWVSLALTYRHVLCRMYSELISQSIQTGGPHASKTAQVKSMRSVKKVQSA